MQDGKKNHKLRGTSKWLVTCSIAVGLSSTLKEPGLLADLTHWRGATRLTLVMVDASYATTAKESLCPPS